MSTLIPLSYATVSPVDQYNQCRDATDEELIAGLKRLEESAFEELIRRYTERLCRHAYFEMYHPVEEPEEIVNAAFFKLWQAARKGNLEYVETERQFSTLLRKSIRYLIIGIVRNQKAQKRGVKKRRVNFEVIIKIIPDRPVTDIDPAAFGEFICFVRIRLNEVSELRLGDIFEMRMQGCTFKSIAHCFGISLSTAQRRLQQAKDWLNENANSLPIATMEPAY